MRICVSAGTSVSRNVKDRYVRVQQREGAGTSGCRNVKVQVRQGAATLRPYENRF